MRYHVLACDYDGTIARHGRVDQPTLSALERVRKSNRRLVLVTGRELPELQSIFPELHLFAWVVAENGALLYRPDTKETRELAPPPPPEFVERLRMKNVAPLSVGRAIIATWHPHETVVLEAIRDLGLEMQVIFNKDAVMALPSGVNKASGLKAALKEMGLTPHEVVAVGDAENDHAMLSLCEFGVAVANALPALMERADLVTAGDHGAGVAELIEQLVADDLAKYEPRLGRRFVEVGHDSDGLAVRVSPYGRNLLIVGPSSSGKSTTAAGFLERLSAHRYQYCLIDPEGDYDNFPGTVTLGADRHGPTVDEALKLLTTTLDNAVINLFGLPLADRPSFFMSLLPRLQELRMRTGRPHWLIVDEAHHLLPGSWEAGGKIMPKCLTNTLFITVHPEHVLTAVLKSIDFLIAAGPDPEPFVAEYCQAIREHVPDVPTPESGEVIFWSRRTNQVPRRVRMTPSRAERRRHTRKYAEGELPPDGSFFFRGPNRKLNLRAQNLMIFLQLADGVDDETWLHHLRAGEYSSWFRTHIKDEPMANEAAAVEKRANELSPAESRAQIRSSVEKYYTQPAQG